MKSVARRFRIVALCTLAVSLCGASYGAVSDHLYRGQMTQIQIYDDPNIAGPFYVFLLELETDASVDAIEFITPADYVDAIPADESTAIGDVETYHWVYDSTDVWQYWGFFADAETLDFYGDGLYTIVLHYADGSAEETTVWYGIPGTSLAIPTPVQRPNLLWPPYDGAAASPVSFMWEPITDPNVAEVYLGVLDAADEYAIADVYDIDGTTSKPYALKEGLYEIEFMLENFYPVTNPDGVPFDLLKSSTLLQPFEVLCSTVYRFWSPATGRHFYTASEPEKDKLINEYSGRWTFEGEAFHAWATPYWADLSPVYRFWSSQSSSHFYTISEGEKNKLIDNHSDTWTYEGVVFYAFAEGSQPEGARPVYRFWKPSDGTHFYTMSDLEVDKILRDYSHVFVFENVAYYAYE